ncbi:hypothetical protein VE04_01731 [Pseudogymnoascus sp. 24MN13]|nr:hypothetical protein VE04_01731 [Pseudogymnoascus sp. 24MN13]
MDKDDIVWDKLEDDLEKWELSVNKAVIYRGVAALILKYRPGEAVELHMPIKGGYNAFYRLEYKDGSSAGMRIPCKGIVKFPEEKIRYEVATMKYVAANTTIPVPKIYGWGTAEENPTGLGPFMIIEYIEHSRTLSDALKDPTLGPKEEPVLDPNIDEQKLSFLYGQMANILLQLSTLSFPRIGSLDQDANGNISVSDMHLTQLTFQHNDALADDDDARDKYIARQLFRRLALSVIDWEFAYVAPVQFSRDPPWWLLLKTGDYWPGGHEAFVEAYGVRMETFLRVLEVEEGKMREADEAKKREGGDTKTDDEDVVNGIASLSLPTTPLSQQMRQSYTSNTWLTNLATRDSWTFDFLFWRYLDEQFFGGEKENEEQDYHARLDLLTEREREAMEEFVLAKVRESEERVIVEWGEEEAKARLAEVMF